MFGGCTHVQEVVGGNWRLGRILCDFWTTADVFCCTASILNIAAIALDRYWLITRNVSYTHARRLPRRRACRLMAVFAWCAAAVISVAPLLGWRTGISRLHGIITRRYTSPVADTSYDSPYNIYIMYIRDVYMTRVKSELRNASAKDRQTNGQTNRWTPCYDFSMTVMDVLCRPS